MAELFELHDKSKFEIFGFSFGPVNNDDMQVRVSSAFDHFYFVNDKSDHDVASLSRQLGIDIAIDLKGFTQDYRLGIFAYGCAPIQVNYLGYPGTMGTDFIHYVIADTTVIPETNQQFFTEKVVYLPHSYQVNDSKRAISHRLFTKPEVGLPGSGFVFCCFNNVYKILPSTFDGWMRILKSIDGSVLWLLDDNPTATSNLQKEAQARGVDPSRLVFAKRMSLDEHLARLKLADLFIDTLPYNAHTTTSDALWAGLPVLTCMGESFASRVAASLLKAIDLPELITHSQQEYEAKAIELATNPALLKAIKDKLAANKLTKPLFDTKLFTKHLEAAYSSMFQRHQDGLPPDHIYINP
jgi:predicted O-linked N-acetylglucosamine transferase (SPINDLY family)